MLNIFNKEIDPSKILQMQNKQYSEKLLLSDTVPANSSKLGSVNVSSLGGFLCLYITGHFTTVETIEATVTDTGLSYLSGKLVDGSNQRQLFNDYIPLDLFLSPGRVKSENSAGVVTDTASNSLFYPQVFQYLFAVNSQILFDVKNDSGYANTYDLVFHGVRFPANQR